MDEQDIFICGFGKNLKKLELNIFESIIDAKCGVDSKFLLTEGGKVIHVYED